MVTRRAWAFAVAVALLSVAVGVGGAGTAVSATGTCAFPVDTSNPPGTVTLSSTPLRFDQTDHDILAMTIVAVGTTRDVVIAGNFTSVKTPDGVSHQATNFAVLDESNGRVLYAGHGVNSYVRAVSAGSGVLYVGGDFTTFGGVSRKHIAALNTSTWAVTPWAPVSSGVVRAIAAGGQRIYYGDDTGKLHAVSPSTGGAVWTDPVSGGAVKALLLKPDQSQLYVGGLFEQVGPEVQHGLVKVAAATGVPIRQFAPVLQADSGVGTYGQYDGLENLSLAYAVTANRLITGDGGHSVVGGQNRDIMQVLDPTTGTGITRGNEGDIQAVAIVTASGKAADYVVGHHRNHAENLTNCPYNYFGDAYTGPNTAILTTWNPGLGGGQDNLDGGNGGIQAIAYDPVTHRLFLGGAFTNYGGSCQPGSGCVGGTPLKSLAEYSVS